MCDSAEKTKSGLLRKHFVSAKKGVFSQFLLREGVFVREQNLTKVAVAKIFFMIL